MRLLDLEPQFMRIEEPGVRHQDVDDLKDAQGIYLLCPKCLPEQPDGVGVHGFILWFLDRGVLPSEEPGPGRWRALGTGYGDLTLEATSSSILATSGCRAHFFIENGQIRMA